MTRPHWEAASAWDSKWNGPAGRPPTGRPDLGSVSPRRQATRPTYSYFVDPQRDAGVVRRARRRLVPHDDVRPRRRAASSRVRPPPCRWMAAARVGPLPVCFRIGRFALRAPVPLRPPARPVSPLAWDARTAVAGSSGGWLSEFFLLLFGVQRDTGDHATLWLPAPFHLEYAPAVWAGARQVKEQSAHPQLQRVPVCGRISESCPTAARPPSHHVEGASDKPRGVR